MSLKSQIQDDIKAAMRAKEAEKLTTLRMLMSEIKKREIDSKSEYDDAAIFKVVSTLIKQRNEAADAFTKGERTDLAEKEIREISFIQDYLPEPLSDDELKALISATITELSVDNPKQMGLVIKAVQEKAAGRADGKRVSMEVKSQLSK